MKRDLGDAHRDEAIRGRRRDRSHKSDGREGGERGRVEEQYGRAYPSPSASPATVKIFRPAVLGGVVSRASAGAKPASA